MVVLAVLSGFTFAFMHQCIQLYMLWSREAKLQMEAAVVLDRMTRELRESKSAVQPPYAIRYISFETVNGTPADPLPAGRYVQYCICRPNPASPRRNMYRLNPASGTDADRCCSGAGCAGAGECPLAEPTAKRVSRSLYSRAGDISADQGFYVEYVDGGTARVEDDRYVLTLKLSDPANFTSPDLVSIFLRTTISPRNLPFTTGNAFKDRSFNGCYSVVSPG